MDQVQFGPELARVLSAKVEHVRMAGAELASFGESEAALASSCGVEIAALEARMILGSSAAERILAAAAQAERSRRPFAVADADMKAMSRLEGVVALASGRIAQTYMTLEGTQSNVAKLGSIVNVVSGIAGLVRSIF